MFPSSLCLLPHRRASTGCRAATNRRRPGPRLAARALAGGRARPRPTCAPLSAPPTHMRKPRPGCPVRSHPPPRLAAACALAGRHATPNQPRHAQTRAREPWPDHALPRPAAPPRPAAARALTVPGHPCPPPARAPEPRPGHALPPGCPSAASVRLPARGEEDVFSF